MEKKRLEVEISTIIRNDNGCETHFEYESVPFIHKSDPIEQGYGSASFIATLQEVRAITTNPITKASFLLFKTTDETEVDGLNRILEYVKYHKNVYYSHTIKWSSKKDNNVVVSYFYGKDAMEALEKFYHGKVRAEYNVYEVKMNPLT